MVSVSVRAASPASRSRLHAFCERWLSKEAITLESLVSSPNVWLLEIDFGSASITNSTESVLVREKWSMPPLGSLKIQVRFVNRNHFNDGREFSEHGSDTVTPLSILFVMAIQENRVRAELACRSKRHRGMNPIFSRFVARCGNDSALIRLSSDHHRFSAQFRPFEQLHGDEERVHVHVQARGDRVRVRFFERSMLCSKPCELRHASSLRPFPP